MSDTRMHVYRNQIITNGNMSGTIISSPTDINKTNTRSFSVQFVFSGSSPVGIVYLMGSDDGGNVYTQISDSILPVTGNTGSCLINVELPAYEFVIVRYDATSGTGTANCYINGKQ